MFDCNGLLSSISDQTFECFGAAEIEIGLFYLLGNFKDHTQLFTSYAL